MLKAKISLILNYFIIALLLNSVGVFVIQMANQFHATQETISLFAPLKDFTILIASFVLASLIPKMGTRKSLILGLFCILLACIAMGAYPSIASSFLFFILLGISFSLIKVATYASVINVTKDRQEHTSFISLLEGFFMVGILSMSWLFGLFVSHSQWNYVFWVLAVATAIAILLSLSVHIEDKGFGEKEIAGDRVQRGVLATIFSSWVTWFFIVLSISYVFIENGLTIWLPTFNNHFLHINTAISIELISILSASLAVGRLFFSAVLKYMNNMFVLLVCMIVALVIFIVSMFVIESMPTAWGTISSWTQLPAIALWLPLVGFVIAPIYPTFASVLLTSFSDKRFQSPISSIIVIFSAVGGMAGAVLLGYLFKVLGPAKGIAVPAVPLFIMLLLTIPYFLVIKHRNTSAK